ncbi:hypothetical protein MAM1_0337c09810 [Mucor ambiguus]|uniref:Uncharacterized protein n=1 Tax=Mucor ambiguus TaxID=91626 RepID=A0A0C9N2M7_9FUNG|nr:hypothetical protein MAM1_0337c09810 [Mucor ambiguus]
MPLPFTLVIGTPLEADPQFHGIFSQWDINIESLFKGQSVVDSNEFGFTAMSITTKDRHVVMIISDAIIQ